MRCESKDVVQSVHLSRDSWFVVRHAMLRIAAHHEVKIDNTLSCPSLTLRAFEVQNDSQDRFAAKGGHLSPLILRSRAAASRRTWFSSSNLLTVVRHAMLRIAAHHEDMK